jgi:hypothetical protein
MASEKASSLYLNIPSAFFHRIFSLSLSERKSAVLTAEISSSKEIGTVVPFYRGQLTIKFDLSICGYICCGQNVLVNI